MLLATISNGEEFLHLLIVLPNHYLTLNHQDWSFFRAFVCKITFIIANSSDVENRENLKWFSTLLHEDLG